MNAVGDNTMAQDGYHDPVRSAFWKNSTVFWAAVVFSVIANMLLLTVPMFILLVYDRVIPSQSAETLIVLTALAFLLIAASCVLDYVRRRLFIRFGARLQESLEDVVLEAALRNTRNPRKLAAMSATEALDDVRDFISSGTLLAVVDMVWIPIFAGVVYLLHPWLGTIAAIGIVLMGTVAYLGQLVGRYWSDRARRANDASLARIHEIRSAEDVVAAQRLISPLRSELQTARAVARDRSVSSGDATDVFAAVARTVRLSLQILVVAVASFLVIEAQMTVGAMVACIVLLGRVLGPSEHLSRQLPAMKQLSKSLRYLVHQTKSLPPPRRESTHVARGDLSINGVDIRAAANEPVLLCNVDLELLAGQVAEIEAPAACGKTVLLQTVLALRQPERGTIRIGGVPISDLDHSEVGHIIGYLPEQIRFVPGTILSNVSGMAQEADVARIDTLLALVGLADGLRAAPGGVHRKIDVHGAPLSSDQRFRLAVARALYNRPRLLVADAPADVLDATLLNGIAALKAQGLAILCTARTTSRCNEVDQRWVLDTRRLMRKQDHTTPSRVVQHPASRSEGGRS